MLKNTMVLCSMQNCNSEGYLSIVVNFFTDKFVDVPYCKTLWRVCENHARVIASPELDIRVQVLH